MDRVTENGTSHRRNPKPHRGISQITSCGISERSNATKISRKPEREGFEGAPSKLLYEINSCYTRAFLVFVLQKKAQADPFRNVITIPEYIVI